MSDSDLLEFRGVRYAYPNGARLAARFPAMRAEAVRDASFRIAPGSATAILGANGSGKSTLLHLCDGLLRPDSGEILWEGAPLDRSRRGLSRLREAVGLLFQDPDDQILGGTVLEDVVLGPSNLGLALPEARRRAEEALERTGMEAYAELPPHLLSQGMRKRVALAGVLAVSPRLLLLDEPTAGLDPRSREVVASTLSDLVAGGTAILLATHDLAFARATARDAMVLAEGELSPVRPVGEVA